MMSSKEPFVHTACEGEFCTGSTGGSCWQALAIHSAGLQQSTSRHGGHESRDPKGAWEVMWAPGLVWDSISNHKFRQYHKPSDPESETMMIDIAAKAA